MCLRPICKQNSPKSLPSWSLHSSVWGGGVGGGNYKHNKELNYVIRCQAITLWNKWSMIRGLGMQGEKQLVISDSRIRVGHIERVTFE